MKPLVKKAGLVAAAYVAAFAIAWAVIALYVAATSGPDRQTYGAMFAFGDSLLFLGVFGVAAIPATGAGLYFLRPWRPFWLALSVAASAWTCMGLAAVGEFLVARAAMRASGPSVLQHDNWSAVAVLRLLVAPLFVLFFLLCALFAPQRSFRIALFAATFVEGAAFASYALVMATSYYRLH